MDIILNGMHNMERMLVKPVLIKSKTKEGSIYRITGQLSADVGFQELYWDRRHKKDIAFHLYFVAPNEEIKDGDLVYVEKYPQVWEYKKAPCLMPYWGNSNIAEKIMASTDKSLGLPAIPKIILNEYIIRQGNLDTLIIIRNEINSVNEVKMITHGIKL